MSGGASAAGGSVNAPAEPVAEGRANREIAERLFLSPRTVEKHVERLLAKTGVTRRAELVAWAAREMG
jgi:DNA-binding CsgD family transcriptional regulator